MAVNIVLPIPTALWAFYSVGSHLRQTEATKQVDGEQIDVEMTSKAEADVEAPEAESLVAAAAAKPAAKNTKAAAKAAAKVAAKAAAKADAEHERQKQATKTGQALIKAVKHKQALKHFAKELTKREKLYQPDEMAIVTLKQNMALLKLMLGDSSGAAALAKECIAAAKSNEDLVEKLPKHEGLLAKAYGTGAAESKP